mgnify:FL=1
MADYLKVVYGEGVRPHTDYPSKLVKHLFDSFNMEAGMKILEPGCGRGEFLKEFKNLGMKAVGLDMSEESREMLSKEDVKFILSNVEADDRLPFPDDSFDVIFNKSFMEHLERPDVFIKEAYGKA